LHRRYSTPLSQLWFLTMEPSSKRRRLAPKVPDPPAASVHPSTPQAQAQPPSHAFPQDQVSELLRPPAGRVPVDADQTPR
jgi:hypothetical protein